MTSLQQAVAYWTSEEKGASVQRAEQLISDLNDPQPEIRATAAWALGAARDSTAAEQLLRALHHDPSVQVRAAAARGLGLLATPEALPALLGALHDDPEVADSAADALVDLGERSVEPALAALREPHWPVRALAASVLGRLSAAIAIEQLIAGLADEHWAVRQNSAQALGELGDKRATAPLIPCLRDVRWEVRYSAVLALGQIGDPEAIAALRGVLQNDDHVIWAEAAWALVTHEGRSAVDTLIATFARVPNASVGHGLASAVASLKESAAPSLLRALEHHDANVRYWAIKALTALSCDEALPRLRWMAEHDIGETPSRAQVRAAARRSIMRITKRQACDNTS